MWHSVYEINTLIYMKFLCWENGVLHLRTHPTASTKMYEFCRWCGLDWIVEGGIEWDVGDKSLKRMVFVWVEARHGISNVISFKGEVVRP
jgi:hypothetical protein